MESRRSRKRGDVHPASEPPRELTGDWVEFEDLRDQRAPDQERSDQAYRRMMDAETLLYKRWEQANGSDDVTGDPAGLLVSLPVAPDGDDPLLWLLGLGEKVAALGGHLEVHAVFDQETVELICEPGPEGQAPIIPPGSLSQTKPATQAPTQLPDGRVRVGLTEAERGLLHAGLEELSRVENLTDDIARAAGFANPDHLRLESEALLRALHEARPLRPKDWRRILIATEIAFASDTHGAGRQWPHYTGQDDGDSIHTLRAAQAKLAPVLNEAENA